MAVERTAGKDMDAQTITQVVVALLGGGALVKLLEWWTNRGKSLRDELRQEIARLENRINHLEEELSKWQERVDEWKSKYYSLLREYQLLEVAAAAKDHIITALERELKLLRGDSDEERETEEDGAGH